MVRRVRSTRTPPVADDRFPGFADVVDLGPAPGVDFAAREVGTNRAVRLRRIAPRGPGEENPAELDRELTTLAAISAHPNVVTLYRSFRAPDGSTVLVLESATRTLADQLAAEGARPPRAATAITVTVAGALETAHRAGVLHGAVSPDTVLFTRFGAPVVGGFGPAAGPATPDGPDAHTAPELLEGAPKSPASDVYGLASTLYELAAGRAAFRAYVGESPASVIVRVLSSRAKPVVAPQVPLELTDLISWAMSPEPAQRPPSPAWLAEELGHIENRQGWPRTRFITG